jgi:hypothetical protein
MKNSLKFARGAALAGTLAKLLAKRKPREEVSGPVESINDSAGTPASAVIPERASPPPPS